MALQCRARGRRILRALISGRPWRKLKFRLVFGGEPFLERARGLVGKIPGLEELRRVTCVDYP